MRPLQPLQPPPNTLQFLTRFLGRPPAPRRASRTFSTRPHHPSTTTAPRTRTPLRANRKYGTTPTPKQTPTSSTTTSSTTAAAATGGGAAAAAETSHRTAARADAILARLPAPLRRYASRLRGAPVAHVVAFLVLHELTAVVPLLGLFGLFHYTEHVPVAWMVGHYGGYVREGVGRFERYFRRKRAG
ncbi:hypothetical protein NEMBOFW57_005282 [Staphylotrichum longicolle]|uniref:Uncharacterized protein n=1 Tax=Staphylotrichum longicolle TaxID=669026 RepID=A0AAD4F013_9PEZI|nr:hypothetical protein NEMBOFW57_005282 [Staphylotrichum longicolle]